MSKASQILAQYTYNTNKPKFKLSNYQIYECKHKETNLSYMIKILKNPDFKLQQYLQKIKQSSSDYVIKIYQYAYQVSESRLVIVQENCAYGTLEKALAKCKRFDNDDSVYVSKMILNGHIDLLRNGVTWYGTQADIQFTDNGLKLSWNNSVPFSEKTPFQQILTRISQRDTASSILPFPPNKMMNDLIAVSKQNASQISLHPILKKKQKIFKKKGKNWIAIRQNKVKGQYFMEISYLAISAQFGCVRVKVMEDGQVDEELMKIYQTKASFVKILDYYKEGGQFVTISQYANDGTVQNYVKRLKASNVGLKENQIQFFFFSVIQPLKFIHESPVKSLNLLNIRNIYIQSGIPKIGEPIPLNNKFKQILIERADVPDFYHVDFKKDPSQKNPIFDTYSLGVLLYKLMYTQYPIFPQGKVHVPTAPTYKKNLKAAIQLFLNIGGNLEQLQKQLQISDDVKLEVKNNQKLLDQINKKNNKQQVVQQVNKVEESQLQFRQDRQKEQQLQNNYNVCHRFWKWLTHRGRDPKGKYSTIYNSQFDNYRKCTTVFIILLFYFFTFFLFFMNGVVNLFNYTRVFTPYSVNILGQTHHIITPNFDQFNTVYSAVANNSVLVLNQTLHCILDDRLYYYDFVRNGSPHWNIYLSLGVLTMILILTFKGIQLCKYSTAKTGFHHYDTTISGSNLSRFAISTYAYFELWFAFALYAFYYLFNYIFHEQHLPCFGGTNWIKLTQTFMLHRMEFSLKYLIALCIVFFFAVLSFIQVINYHKIQYNLLKNPIFIYTPFYLALFIALRIGAYNQFVPSYLHNEQKIIGSSYLDLIGYFPQILIIVEIILCVLIDQIFYKLIYEKLNKFVIEQSHTDSLKVYD